MNNANSWPLNYGNRYQFPPDVEFQLKVRLGNYSNKIGTWFKGRIHKPSISINNQTLTFSGFPVDTVYGMSKPLPCQEWPDYKDSQEAKSFCDSGGYNNSPKGMESDFPDSYDQATTPSVEYPNGSFAYWESRMGVINHVTAWSITDTGINKTGNCEIGSGKVGIVGSNALIYSTSPPTWNQDDNSLNYGVGSFHTDLDGKLQEGTFDIAIPTTFAKCLWNQDFINAKAEISLTYGGSEPKVIASSIKQDVDMVYLSVAGFTYSTPKVKVKVVPTTTSPSAQVLTPTKNSKGTKLIKIFCVKSGRKIVVSAKNPICPRGYVITK